MVQAPEDERGAFFFLLLTASRINLDKSMAKFLLVELLKTGRCHPGTEGG